MNPIKQISLFSASANIGAGDHFGVGGNVQVGNPLNNNFLMPVIIGLGLLSLFNIALTVLTPLLKKAGAEDNDNKEENKDEKARQQRNIVELASNVMEAIQTIHRRQQE